LENVFQDRIVHAMVSNIEKPYPHTSVVDVRRQALSSFQILAVRILEIDYRDFMESASLRLDVIVCWSFHHGMYGQTAILLMIGPSPSTLHGFIYLVRIGRFGTIALQSNQIHQVNSCEDLQNPQFS